MALLDSQIFIWVLLAVIVILLIWTIRLEIRLKRLTHGTNKESLETGLQEAQVYAREFGSFKNTVEKHLQEVERRLNQSIQNVATIRFDPFKGSGHGGNQSFATALLDEKGSGVVISTIHTRERVGIFSKPIKEGVSEIELTPEESEVIREATKNS